MEIPQPIETATASTDAETEVAPLTPQKNAVGALGRNDATFIPRGNGTPITRPIGARMPTAAAMRTGVVSASNTSMTPGVAKPNVTTTTNSATNGKMTVGDTPGFRLMPANRSVPRLPIPLNSNSENRTTESAYVGWPRKIVRRCNWAISSSRNPNPIAAKNTTNGSMPSSDLRLVVSSNGSMMQRAVSRSTATARLKSTNTGRAR